MECKMIRAGTGSSVWRFTMAFTGIGSTMLGPFLPHLLVQWQLHDHQAGMLVASLFLGSFSGTLLLSEHIASSLRRGAWAAAVGCALFAWCTHLDHGFAGGLLALLPLGFGMGQLMSSINLLVGATPPALRARGLANLGAAWCAGAILSPILSTVMFSRISPAFRLGLLAPLFLLPLIATPDGLHLQPVSDQDNKDGWSSFHSHGVLVCTAAFLLYGGIEASINAWGPSFAARYSGGTLAASQWILSLFWLGLIAGRTLIATVVSPSLEIPLLRVATIGSSLCLLSLLFFTSMEQIWVGTAFLGVCIAPTFPLLLSTTLSYGYSNRVMGMILASCALGSALFPWLLGILSSLFSLRFGMALPLLCLLSLAALRWNSPRRTATSLLRHAQ
jgi:MFS transporter, FHS family, glucose/mannose:H+ symporter